MGKRVLSLFHIGFEGTLLVAKASQPGIVELESALGHDKSGDLYYCLDSYNGLV